MRNGKIFVFFDVRKTVCAEIVQENLDVKAVAELCVYTFAAVVFFDIRKYEVGKCGQIIFEIMLFYH